MDLLATDEELELFDDEPDGAFPRPFGAYRLIGEIGRGGQGVVYEAEDTRLGRRVALKVLTNASFATAALRKRFRREAEVASRLDHPGICAVYEFGAVEGMPFIAMRLVSGKPLEADPADRSRAVVARVVRVVERAARAVHVAHEAGLVHRDLKPDNILVTEDDEPVLLDFGLARDVSGEASVLTQADAILGTPAYMAPEQIKSGRDVDRRTDVHALGVILFECVTGSRPFRGATLETTWRQITEQDADDPRTLNPAVSRDLAAVIMTALEKRPERRYQDADAMAQDLLRILDYQPVAVRPPSALVKCTRWVQRHPVVAALSFAIALLLSIGLVTTLVLLNRANDAFEATRAALRRTEGGRCWPAPTGRWIRIRRWLYPWRSPGSSGAPAPVPDPWSSTPSAAVGPCAASSSPGTALLLWPSIPKGACGAPVSRTVWCSVTSRTESRLMEQASRSNRRRW